MPDTKEHVLEISRSFPAPRELVFRAWTSAEHLKRWFGPEGWAVQVVTLDFRPGGERSIRMRSPDGQEILSHGKFVEIDAPTRFVIAGHIGDPPKFAIRTTVTFEDDGEGGTLMTIHQVYTSDDPASFGAIEGARKNWGPTLEKLEREVARIKAEAA